MAAVNFLVLIVLSKTSQEALYGWKRLPRFIEAPATDRHCFAAKLSALVNYTFDLTPGFRSEAR